MNWTPEFIKQKMAEVKARRQSPDYQPLTFELLKQKLANGEIDEDEYIRLDRLYCFSEEAKQELIRLQEGPRKISL